MLSCIRSGRASTKEMTTRASSPDETLSGMQAFEPLGDLPAKCLAVNDDAAAQANLIPSRRCPEAALMRANTCTSAVKHVRSAIPNLRRAVRVHRPAVARIVHAVNLFLMAGSPEPDLCFMFSQSINSPRSIAPVGTRCVSRKQQWRTILPAFAHPKRSPLANENRRCTLSRGVL
jgi:hypothetical protein